MSFIILDNFPPWIIYILAVSALAGFALALVLLVRSYLTAARNPHAAQMMQRSGRQSWFFVIAGAIAVWFLGTSMYLRFHVLGLDSQRIELHFFWPRAPVTIAMADLAAVKFSPAHRTCGHMEVSTKDSNYLSVNFRDCKVFELLRDEFTAKTGIKWQ